MLDQAGFVRTGREVALNAPLTEDAVRALKVGDVVMVSGRIPDIDAGHSAGSRNRVEGLSRRSGPDRLDYFRLLSSSMRAGWGT
jgi:hypothetical protein